MDRMIKSETAAGETPKYEIADLLVSRTDQRGTILSVNEAFERISCHDWENLNNAPHNLIRHPDMPKGVFWLIWEALKQKKPIGAFQKNATKNGTFYWVFTFFAPQGDGYVSISMKPTSRAVEMISNEYAALLERETEEDLSADQCAVHFLERINGLGHNTYDHFVASLAFEQIRARDKVLRHSCPDRIEKLAEITTEWGKVQSQCDRIKDAHGQISDTPTNLRVQAAHLNDKGIPLSVIASNFTTLAVGIEEIMAGFLKQASAVEAQLNQGAFTICLEVLMQEVVSLFHNETTEMDGIDWQAEGSLINLQRLGMQESSHNALTVARHEIDAFSSLLDETARIMSGLSVAKVMCEIENAYVGADSGSGVTGIIEELNRFQTVARECLFDIRLNLTQISQSIMTVQSNSFNEAKAA